MSRKGNIRGIKTLKVQLAKFEASKNYGEQSEVLNQIGDEYRQNQINSEALSYYKDAVKAAEKARRYDNLAHANRNIASILCEEGDESCIKYVKLYLHYAKECNGVNQIQLALHECAFIHLGFAQVSKEHLLEALENALKCRKYLAAHASEIDSDSEAVRTAENSKRRTAGINSLLSEIFQQFNDYEKAIKYNDYVFDYAEACKDYPLMYSCLLMKVELVRGQKKVVYARDRRDLAHTHIKHNLIEAELEYCKQSLNFFPEKYEQLYQILKMLLKHAKHKSFGDLAKEYLMFIWKYQERLKRFQKANQCEKYRISESIGDEASNFRMFELALKHYKVMLSNASSFKEKDKAIVSVAETSLDLGDIKNAVQMYTQYNSLISLNCERGDPRIAEAEATLTVVQSKDTSQSVSSRFSALKKVITSNKLAKHSLLACYEALVMLMHINRTEFSREDIDKYQEKWRELRQEVYQGPSLQNEDDEEEDENDEFGNVPQSRMISQLEAKFTTYQSRENLIAKKDSRNTKGETMLHEASRDGNLEKVKALIECGYDVNARDYGGWTPLSEAVNHGNLDVARVLLQNGAFVDCQAGQSLVNEDGNEADSAGGTPLMEACVNGHVAVARLLLTFKASVTKTNNSGHTALHFLRRFIEEQDSDSTEKTECEKLAKEIEAKQRKEGYVEPSQSIPLFRAESGSKLEQRKRCHSPVPIDDDIFHKPEKRRSTKRSRVVDDLPEFDLHEQDRFTPRSPVYNNDSDFDDDIILEELPRGYQNEPIITEEPSLPPPRPKKRPLSPASSTNSLASKRSARSGRSSLAGHLSTNLTISRNISNFDLDSRRNSSYVNSGDVTMFPAVEHQEERPPRRKAFSKIYSQKLNPFTKESVLFKNSFADADVNVDEILATIDAIFDEDLVI